MTRILAIDPGAERAGWAVLDTGPEYIASGVVKFPRPKKQPFQEYRMMLAQFWVAESRGLITTFEPDHIVSETVPSRGFNIPEQGYLANVQITTLHAVAFEYGRECSQVSASAVKNHISIRSKSKKITKPQVRNGVLSLLPELKPRASNWVKIFEEPDALAIGLFFLGHSLK